MGVSLKQWMTKLADFWKKAGKRTKTLLIGGAACLVLLIVVLEIAVNSTSYELMYSGLSDADAGQVVTQLKSMGVKYKVNGSGIYVDKGKADETRMQLAENGYPDTTLNYNVYLSGTSWAMTDSDKNRMALYQTQNRLQDTVRTIPGVKSCVVTIGQSSDDTYVLSTDKVPTTASVKLNLKTGVTLTNKQVNGIVQLVAHSVSDLSADNVTVLDSDGNMLNGSENDASGATSDQLALQSQVENELQRKVLSVLTPVFGSGNVVAAAGATMDFSQKTTSTVTYTSPTSGAVGLPSSQSNNMTVSGTGTTGASGVVGVNSGEATYTTTSSAVSGGTVTQTSSQASYLYNTVNQQIQSQGGTLTGLTISVQINSKSPSAANVNVDDIKQSVAYAVGLTDTADISVQMLPFASSDTSSNTASTPASGRLPVQTLAAAGAGAAVLLIALLTVLLILHRARRKREAARLAAMAAAAQAAVVQPGAPRKEKEKPEPVKTIEETLEESSSQNTVKNQIEDFADKKPELVAQLLRNWLKD